MRTIFLCLIFSTIAVPAWAGASVQLELVADAQGAAMLFQDWGQALSNAGIKNVRLRSAADSDKVGIETRGDAAMPIYVVTGVVKSRDELLLPGGRRFRRDQLGSLRKWLDELAERGPNPTREKTAAFGLSEAQMRLAMEDLAAPVGFSTAGMSRTEAARKIAGKLKFQVKFDAPIGEDKCQDDLSGLACGTALACLLRPANLGFVPRRDGSEIVYSIVKIRTDDDAWPLGRASGRPPQEDMPGLYEFLNVNIRNVSAAQAIDAIAKRLKASVLLDHLALAQHNLDPAKSVVALPQSRTTYSVALRKLLFQAKLKYEIRLDEAGTAFVWITSAKP